jgi:hypothetical protein
MNHPDALPRLADYFDGTLPPKLHREIEAHLAECAACREELSSLGALLDTVATMAGKQIEPPRDLWPGISSRISGPNERSKRADRRPEPEGRPPNHLRVPDELSRPGRTGSASHVSTGGRIPWFWITGAAGLAVAAVLVVFVMRGANGRFPWGDGAIWGRPASDAPATFPADSTSRAMNGEIAMLEAQVRSTRSQIQSTRGAGQTDSTTAVSAWRTFEQGLDILDLAIRDSREALQRDPRNPILQKSLLATYQKQLELIRWANRIARHV